MFKFLRKILVLGLVFSLSIPSFAAVSVSDGSAFVSKAEFSASLNNLSSRMSNLENSLDAKIDSLVSSYLSRNGIWNGESQTLANDTFFINGYLFNHGRLSVIGDVASICDVRLGYNESTKYDFGTLDDKESNFYDKTEILDDDYNLLVETIGKSGLLCVNGYYRSNSDWGHIGRKFIITTNAPESSGYNFSTGSLRSDIARRGSTSFALVFKDNDKNVYSYTIGTSTWTTFSDFNTSTLSYSYRDYRTMENNSTSRELSLYSGQYPLVYDIPIGTKTSNVPVIAYFFVNKGDKITFALSQTTGGFYYPTCLVNTTEGSFIFKINNISVY